MNKVSKNKGLLIGIVTLVCVGLLIAGLLIPMLNNEGGGKSKDTSTGTPLTTFDDTVIEPGSNKISGLTNEDWFSQVLTDEKLDFDTENLGNTEFTSSDTDDQRDIFGGAEEGQEGVPTSDKSDQSYDGDNGAQIPRDVEEADIIKLVGDTLYILNTYRGLMLIDVSEPDSPEIISRVPLFGYPVEMYIVEPRAYIILTHYYNAFLWAEDDAEAPQYRHGSEIVVVDISELTSPVVEKYIELNGFITDSRRVGEVIYAVANNFDDSYYYYGGPEVGIGLKGEAVDAGGVRAEPMDKSNVPEEETEVVEEEVKSEEVSVTAEPEPVPEEKEKEEEESYYEEPKYGTVVVSINLEDLTDIREMDREMFPGTSNQIHVTEHAIFVAQPEYDYYYDPFFGYRYEYSTKVTYVDISDYHGEIKIRDNFEVDGYLEDRYQMDYYDDTFRIVTHFWGEGEKLGESKLWVYDTSNPDDIKKKGELSIDDAGTLMATRFAEDRAYTIHLPYSIDPLDVIDLSDPSKPVLTDVFEMPGWVTHMEVRGYKILALGVDDSDGKQRVAVSLFDVTDPYNAEMEERVIIGDGYSWSTANWDPKALSVIDDQNLVLVPFESYSYDKNGNYQSFNGLQIVKFDLEVDDLTAGGAIEQMGTVQRTRANSERIFAISYKELQVIDASVLDKPKITATLELCNNIIDVIPLGDYCVQIISEYDYMTGSSVTKLRTVKASNPDTSVFLAEKSVEYGVIKYYLNDDLLYVMCNKYDTETWESEGHILVFDYSEPTKPKLRSDFTMEYYMGNNYWRYYDWYYYDWYYYPTAQALVYDFILLDSDILVYHPNPQYNYYYIEDDVVYDETDMGGSDYSEDEKREEENKTVPPEEPVEKKETVSEPPSKNDWFKVDEALYFIDLSNPDKPTDLGNLTLENTTRINGLYANGKTLYLIQYEDISYYDNYYNWHYEVKYYLTKLDLSTPTEPALAAPINIPGGFLGMNDEGTILYTQSSVYDEQYNWHQSLNILKLSDGKATLTSAIDLGDSYASVIIQDSTIIISYNNYDYYYYDDIYYGLESLKGGTAYNGLIEPVIKTKIQIIDATDPKNLQLKTTIGLKNYAYIYKFENDKLYLQLSEASGLIIYDLSETSTPAFLGYYPTYGWITSIREDVKAGRIYLACGLYGVLVVDVD